MNVLTVASLFVLFIAMLNLLNFSLSEIPMRMRGINTRRVMGASVGGLRMRMILENVLFAFIGLIIGILLIVLFQRSETCMKLVSGDSFGQIFLTDTNRDHLDKILSSSDASYKIYPVEAGGVIAGINN